MTNKELIMMLSKFPEDSKVNFWLFGNICPIRCTADESSLMIKQSPHTGEIGFMLDIPKGWEDIMIEYYEKYFRKK